MKKIPETQYVRFWFLDITKKLFQNFTLVIIYNIVVDGDIQKRQVKASLSYIFCDGINRHVYLL